MSGGLLAWGMAVALFTAFLQSLSYVLSRRFFASGGTPRQLLLTNCLLMAVPALFLLPELLPASSDGVTGTGLPHSLWSTALWTAVAFVAGQFCWLLALRLTAGSVLASLYNLKIIAVGVGFSLYFHEHLTFPAVAGMFLAAAAAVLMGIFSGTGEKSVAGRRVDGIMPFRGVLALAASIALLAGADVGIVALIRDFSAAGCGYSRAAAAAGCLNVAVCGLIMLPALPAIKPKPRHFMLAVPYTAVCMLSIYTVNFAFSVLDPVYTNVLLSTRGLFSLLMGAVLAHFGFTAVEERAAGRRWLGRAAAALLMFAAIAVYSFGKI